MNLINPSVKEIDFNEPGKKIEYAGRMCYKSQDKITDESYKTFIKNIANRGHLSVLEHEKFTMCIDSKRVFNKIRFIFERKFFPNTYFDVSVSQGPFFSRSNNYIITSNIRGWLELLTFILQSNPIRKAKQVEKNANYFKSISSFLNNKYGDIFTEYKDFDEISFLKFAFEIDDEYTLRDFLSFDEFEKHVYKTFHITTDRAVTHQIVRHRRNSFSQESQRYVNYSLDKFGSSIRFILPYSLRKNLLDKGIDTETVNLKNIEDETAKDIIKCCKSSEKTYFSLVENGTKPEVARCVLPNMTATEIVTTASITQWKRLLGLRCDPHAQDDIREIANLIKESLYKK